MGWIADVVPEADISSTLWGNVVRDRVVQVFDSDAERDATAVPRPGMVAWSILENELAVWVSEDTGWMVLMEMWRPWTPQVYMGANLWPVATNHGSWFRRTYGAVDIKAYFEVSIFTAAVPEDILHVTPPYVPAGSGNFGIMTVHRDGTQWLGPVGAYDPTQLACINNLSTTGTITASLVHWGDLSAGAGNLEITMSGSYITGQVSSTMAVAPSSVWVGAGPPPAGSDLWVEG